VNRTRYNTPVIFGRNTLETVAGGMLVVGSNDTLRLERRAADGSVLHSAALPWVPIPVTKEWMEAERQLRVENDIRRVESLKRLVNLRPAEEARAIANRKEHFPQLPHRPTLPAFSELRSDARGNVWVAEYAPPGAATRRWVVLDSLFEPVATIEIPPHIQIRDLGASDLVGVTHDELERAMVGLWAIRR